MRKLIEMSRKDFIICDNPACDFKITTEQIKEFAESEGRVFNEKQEGMKFINAPCPRCGENLLTERDYLDDLKVQNKVAWINKWFSWITFFVPKNTKPSITTVHSHNGIKFEHEK